LGKQGDNLRGSRVAGKFNKTSIKESEEKLSE
jgi:hypothetical protein